MHWQEVFSPIIHVIAVSTIVSATLFYLSSIQGPPSYVHDYASPKEARQHLRDYVQFYNHQRLHQSLDYQTPASVYFHTGAAGQRQNE